MDYNIGMNGLQILEFASDETNCADNGLLYVSKLKQPRIMLGTPTNNKKWKKMIVNCTNNGDGAIPLYVNIEVDDVTVLSPEYYYVRIDEDDNYIYYERLDNPNEDISLKSNMQVVSGAILGELILGATKLGDQRNQTFKMDVNAKGKGISAEISDNYINKDGELVGTNTKPFSISDIGFIYKLKKVKAE